MRKIKRSLALFISVCMVVVGLGVNTMAATVTNVANGRNEYTFMTSNANNGTEGFCYEGNGFSAINTCNENLGNGNNMLGATATTDEVALYVDLGASYDITNALIYQGSTNSNYYDSYCKNYSIYYSTEQVNASNGGNITWNLAGTCTNGSIYSGAKISSAENVTSTGDAIDFGATYNARSVKIVFDKASCMGTGSNGGNTGTVGTVSLLSVRIYATTQNNTSTPVVSGETTDILFIGNSMTYYNELQDIFEALATKMGKNVNCKAATNGGKNLIYQSSASNIISAIDDGGYEVVIIQDIVSSFNANNLKTGAKSIIAKIKQYNPNAKILFYEPWPKENVLLGSSSKLDYFTQGYIEAARENGGILAPAGEAFYHCYVAYGYTNYCDGLHPTPMGSFTSAAAIYYALYANEGLTTFTSSDLSDLNSVVNVAQSTKKDYTLEEFNNIMAAGHKYARAVAPAVADTSGNTKYTSALYTLEDPTEKVSADLSAYSKIDLGNASVINVSSSVNTSNTGDKIIDGNMSTRWESAYADPQYFTIRLDKTYKLNGIKLFWEGAASRKYVIETSTDNNNWTTVFEQNVGTGGTESIKFDTVTNANYVRLYSTARTSGYGVSLFETELYGSVSEGSVVTPSEPEIEQPTETPTTPVESGTNLAVGKTALASGAENTAMDADKAVDGNDGTRFSSNYADDAWLYVDLGATYNVNKVYIDWEGAYGKAYDIQVSNNGTNWTTVKSLTNQDGGEDTITFNATSARYVKLQGVERATGYGYSIWEFGVYATGEATDNEPETNTPSVSENTNVAAGKTAYTSSNEADGMAGNYAVDENDGTRWASSWTDNEWIYVDLGTAYNVNKVVLNWEGAYGKAYDIQVSNDGTNWTTVKSMSDQNGGEDVITFDATSARYVRMQGISRGTGYGYSLWEMEVYATTESADVEDAVSGTNVALKKTTYQSGYESNAMAADRAVDGNSGTRFSSNYADDAWMYIDLGATYSINKVYINWEGAYGKAYNIQVSNDGTNWTTVKSLTNQDGGEDTITFDEVNARYVKMQGVTRGTGYGYSMWDFEVYAK